MEEKIDPYPDGSLITTSSSAWQLIKSYWRSNQRFPAYLFFSIVMFLTIPFVGLDVVFNYWYYYFYDVLQGYDESMTMRLFLVFFMVAAFYLLFEGYRYLISQIFGSRWRHWLTEQFIGRWLQRRGIWVVDNTSQQIDSSTQRIKNDVGTLINYSLDLSMGLIGVLTTFLAFIYVLWQLSGELTISLGPLGKYDIPGYLVWAGVLYVLIGVVLTYKIGRPFYSLISAWQRGSASAEEQRSSSTRTLKKTLLWFVTGCYQLSIVLPFVIALPNFVDKVFLLSWLIQSFQAFNSRFQDSLGKISSSRAG